MEQARRTRVHRHPALVRPSCSRLEMRIYIKDEHQEGPECENGGACLKGAKKREDVCVCVCVKERERERVYV